MTDFDTKHESGWVLTHIPACSMLGDHISAEPPKDHADEPYVAIDDDGVSVEMHTDMPGMLHLTIPLDVVRWLLARHAEDTKPNSATGE